MKTVAARTERVPTYCYQCVAGPDLLTVKVEDGVATEVEPNFGRPRHPPGRRQALRQGLRTGAEDLQPASRADADEANQPTQGPR